MKDKHFIIEQELRDLYYNPEIGFQSAEKLYKAAKQEGLNVSRKLVKEWLKTQETYTKFKPIKKRHAFQKTFVKDLDEQLQMDLVDMKKYNKENKGYYWILTGIEILSRYAFAIPVYRKDKENMTKAVARMLTKFKQRFTKYPKFIQFDKGKEFYNVGVKSLLRDAYNIKYFSTYSSRKEAIVERFNRTLKTIMWKYFDANNTHEWICDGLLDSFLKNYNSNVNRGIGMKPSNVNQENKHMVWIKIFGQPTGKFTFPKI